MKPCRPQRPPTLRYFDIAWFSPHDGPGQRVVLFLQGCPLRCPWCHSPQSLPRQSPLLFFPARCQQCRRCARVCPHGVHSFQGTTHHLRREACVHCGRCLDACPVSSRHRLSGALALPTREVTVAELWRLLHPQLDLVREIGGLTLSGGEALLQTAGVRQLLRRCRTEGIHTAVETSGAVSRRCFDAVASLVDCWLFGLRPTAFYVPPHPQAIERNLAFVRGSGRKVIIRMPVVAGITDLPASLAQIVDIMQVHRLRELDLLPFHAGTPHYYEALGRSCPIGPAAIPSAERLRAIQDFFGRSGITASVVQ